MNAGKIRDLIVATLEPPASRILIELPDGSYALVRGVTSQHGDIIIQVTHDVREELK